VVRWVLRHSLIALLAFAGVIGAAVWLIRTVPTSFVPSEDMGFLYGALILPDGATLQRTGVFAEDVQKALAENPAVEHVFMVTGFDLIGGGNKTNAGTMFVTMHPWGERTVSSFDLVGYGAKKTGPMRDGLALMFNPPPIRGLGQAAGFEAYVQNRASDDPKELAKVLQNFTGELRKRADLTGINSFFRPTVPQVYVEIDREKALALGIPISDVFDALQGTMGSLYVNDFNKYGRTFRVQISAEAAFRSKPEDLGAVYVRSTTSGEMLPLKALLRVSNSVGAEQLDRFNGFVAAKVLGAGAPGISSGQAIAAVEEVAAKTLPPGYFLEWSAQAFQERRVGNASRIAFGLALIMVFLILAAQYERWSLPLAVLLAVPFAVLGALLAVLARGMSNDIYFQIGLVTLIALAAKNAILIVEFAAQKQTQGMSLVDAAVEAARLRFRPIIMTSLAFVLGVLPLVVATGAGAAARRSMGTGVFGGMLAATFVATLFIPLFFVLLGRKKPRPPEEEAPVEEVGGP
jgi:HAE1 family hydrophobic/amphiphilic exporter-1/multidrug efflux pump